jgi:hypothetical protein
MLGFGAGFGFGLRGAGLSAGAVEVLEELGLLLRLLCGDRGGSGKAPGIGKLVLGFFAGGAASMR